MERALPPGITTPFRLGLAAAVLFGTDLALISRAKAQIFSRSYISTAPGDGVRDRAKVAAFAVQYVAFRLLITSRLRAARA